MTQEMFFEKLEPFFTFEEIVKLEANAIESFKDAFGRAPTTAQDYEMSYDVEAQILYDWSGNNVDDFNYNFAQIIGREYTPEEYKLLVEQMDKRW